MQCILSLPVAPTQELLLMEEHYIYGQKSCYGFCYNVYSEKLNDRILFSLYMNATVETKTWCRCLVWPVSSSTIVIWSLVSFRDTLVLAAVVPSSTNTSNVSLSSSTESSWTDTFTQRDFEHFGKSSAWCLMTLKSPGDSVVCGVYNSYWEKISNTNNNTVTVKL